VHLVGDRSIGLRSPAGAGFVIALRDLYGTDRRLLARRLSPSKIPLKGDSDPPGFVFRRAFEADN